MIGVNVQLLGSRRAEEFQKEIVPPSNIINKGGGGNTKVYGDMQSKLLAWVKAGDLQIPP